MRFLITAIDRRAPPRRYIVEGSVTELTAVIVGAAIDTAFPTERAQDR
jgi:hypothetical protein